MNTNQYLIILLLALLILVVVYFLTKLYNNVEQFQSVEDNGTPIETSTNPPTETPTFAPVSVGSNNISNKLNTLSDKLNNLSDKFNTISDEINTIDDHSTVQITSNSPKDIIEPIESIINKIMNK